MIFQELLKDAFNLIHELSDAAEVSNEDKHAALTDLVADAIETADNVDEFMPLGFRHLVKAALDNQTIDDYQRKYLAQPIAEAFYQLWKLKQGLLA